LSGASDQLFSAVAALSPYGESHAEQLKTWAAHAEREQFAITHGEREDGLSVVAVPVHRGDGVVVAAVSIAGPTPRFGDEIISQYVSGLKSIAKSAQDSRFGELPGASQIKDRG
jgi:DNA-binding IclR family transcriptional regulator